MKRETEESWASERVENSLLRKRSTTSRPKWHGLPQRWKGRIRQSTPSSLQKPRAIETAWAWLQLAAMPISRSPSTSGKLADRIRALQTYASRVSHSDEPKSRN